MKKTAKKLVAGTVGAAGLFLVSAATAVNADSVHHVIKNDTVWNLSQKFGVSIKSIEQLNHIDQNTNMIYVGQDLKIPNKDTQTPKNNTHTYTVQSGDSLWAIAQKFNTSVDHLKQLNGLTSSLVYAGQTLNVDGQAIAQPAKAATPVPAKTVAQPVQQQAPVAKASVTSSTQKAAPVVSSVSSATQAQPATSSVATSKVAPAVTSSSATTVSSSQAPTSSSTSTSVSSSSSSQQTVVSSSSSQTSVASSAVSSAAPASSVSSQSSSKQAVIAANHTTATVKSGDSLYAIAQEYGVSIASLREANPNLGNSLTVGQSLIVNNPTKNPAVASSSSKQAQASSASSQQAPQTREAAPQVRTTSNQQAAQNNNQQQNNSNNQQAAQVSSQAQQSSTTRTGSGSNVVSYAESLIGVPYVYGGTTPNGFDCSGFVQYVYNHFGKSLPRTTTQQENCGTQIPVNQAQPGDLYFWGSKGSAYHVAICVGNGKYVAAPEPGQSVSIGSTQYFQPSFAVRL